MKHELVSVRHGLGVVAGAAIIWATNQAAIPVLRLIPGFAAQLPQWECTLNHGISPLVFALLAFLAALAASLWQEVPRVRGAIAIAAFGVAMAVVTFFSRANEVPSAVYGLLASFAVIRGIGVIAASFLILRFKTPRTGNSEVATRTA